MTTLNTTTTGPSSQLLPSLVPQADPSAQLPLASLASLSLGGSDSSHGTQKRFLFGNKGMSSTPSLPTNGSDCATLAPYIDNSNELGEDHFQSIIFQVPAQNYSHEELRLADYRRGKRFQHTGHSLTTAALVAAASTQAPLNAGVSATVIATKPTQHSIPKKENRKAPKLYPSLLELQLRHFPQLLQGPGIEVCVGGQFSSKTWSLPKALISHYSDFLKAACTREFKEREENRILLPKDDPEVFSCFVNWLYYGSYNMPLDKPSGSKKNFHARTWILGDKLMATDFKNYAMAHAYSTLQGPKFDPNLIPIIPSNMRHVCDNTTQESPLRRLFLDVCAAHFSDATFVQGTIEEWDDVLCDYADARIFLLQASRANFGKALFVKSVEDYLEQ